MNRWMAIARDEGIKGMDGNEGGPFGAVVVREGEIISRAHNEVLATNDPTAHAEVLAIRRASAVLGRFDLSDCVLYTSCYPCPMCLGAVFWSRIPTVYYGATQEDAAEGGFDDARFHAFVHDPAQAITLREVEREQARQLFTRWLAKEDRRLY